MKPEDRKRLKQHIEMIVEHRMPIVFCPNCEKYVECIHTAELYECKECGEDFARYIVSRQPANSDVSMTQDVLTDIKTGRSVENTNPDYYKQEIDRLTASLHYANTVCMEQKHVIDRLNAGRRWIPVSERLPDHKQSVLAVADREVTNTYYDVNFRKWSQSKYYWFPEGEVTHWMPLPEPPTD